MEHVTDKPKQFPNPAKSSSAKIVFARIPHFEFLTQRFVLPSINVNPVQMPTPYTTYARPGDMIQFEKPWTLEIVLDEKYRSWWEIFTWIKTYAGIDREKTTDDFDKIKSDARIILFDNESDEIGSIVFKDTFPFSMSQIGYNTTDTTYEYLKFNCSFEYSTFDLELF